MPHEEKSFVSWMRNNNVLFTGDEYYFRLGIFMTHARLVSEFKGNFKIALNKFACTTPAEYNAILGLLPETGKSGIKMTPRLNYKAPESIDWREKGAVTAIQEQGNCGACWAFSATAGAEGAWVVKGNKQIKISEQCFIDCTIGCWGCYGGLRDSAYDYVKSDQGGKMQLEEDYPYLGINDQCHFDATKGVGNIDSYLIITDEVELVGTVAEHGPTTAGIDSTSPKFMLYSHGIYDDDTCSQEIKNHGIMESQSLVMELKEV